MSSLKQVYHFKNMYPVIMVLTCQVLTVEHLIYLRNIDRRKMMVGRENLQQHCYQHWRLAALRKYIMFGVSLTG